MAKIYAPDPPAMQSTCAKCGHANREAAHFCAGCGAPLAFACASCGAELAPSARFCDACGAAAAPGSEGGRAARKTLTVVFADLAGSTALQERLDPESARRVMTRFYDEMRDVLEAHGGRLEKLIGDAVVGVFGRPSVREDDALRAVRAAAAMVSALDVLNEELDRSWGVQLRMRTGVNTGELVVGDAGELIGDTMNVAARLEQAAPEGEVLVGQPTWRLVHHAVELQPVEPLLVKGKSEPLAAWRVVSAAAIDRGRAGSIETPLVGREPELDRLRVVFDGVLAARACRLVTVVGAPGVGKSRLAHELGVSLAEQATVVEGHCEPTGEGITFLPVAEILRVLAGVGEADPAETVRDKLRSLTLADDPDRERLVESVAGVLGISEPASAQETFWALRRGVEFLARERPLVLILDDLHWGQPMLLDLVEHLVEWVRDAPVLLVALARPELREEREVLVSAGRRAVDVIELEPLDQQESLELVGHLLGDVRVPVALSTRILETTEGNPLFLGETLRMLVDEGALRRDGDAWVARDGIEAVEVPPTIQALLAARIERLRADERTVIERASVIGKQFYRGAVADLVSPPVRLAIDGHLEALRRKDMVEPEGTYWIDEPVYRFHHVLIRDAAYRSLLKEARADLHERFADWLEVKAGEFVGEHEEVIAFHLEQAHEYRRQLGPLDERGRALGMRAAERLGSAGRRALAREDLAAAANLLSRALARDAGETSRLLWDLCDAVLSAGDTASAAPLVGRYADACGNERADAVRARVLRGQLANLTGAPDVRATALALIESAATLAEQGDQEGEARAHQVAAGAYARLGQVGAVEEELDRALAAARAAGDRRRTTAVLAAAPRAALWGPSPVVRASGRCLDVVRILRMTPGNRHVEAVALRCQAVLEAMRGRVQAAREILAACRTTLEELGLGFELNETAVHAGIVELLADEPVAACEQLRAARAGFEALGAAAGAAQAAALLARALVTVGDPDALAEAIEQSEFAEAHSGEDLKTVIIWTSARAQALGRFGDIDSALSLARHASTLAEPTDALADKGDSALALADVLLAAECGEQARQVANSAAAWYEAKGHTVGAERSRQLADTVTPRAATVAPRPAAQSPAPAPRAVLGDRPPERYWAEFLRRFAARDATSLADLHALGWTAVDHREMPWDSLHGRDEAERFYRSAFEVAPQTSAQVDEILACSDRVIALRTTWRGSGGALSGDFEFRVGFVDVIENGLSVGREQYEYDDDDAMLARFTALSAGDPEGFWKRYKALYDAHDLDGLLGLIDENWVMVDHRKLGWVQWRGIDGARKQLASAFELSADSRVEIEEELARDGRILAARGAWRGSSAEGGPFESSFGMVVVVDGERWVSADLYEPDDRRAMIARYTELGGGVAPLGDRPPERWWREHAQRYAARELDQLFELFVEDCEFVEHRSLGWPSGGGRRGVVRNVETVWDGSTDIRVEVDEVLACEDRVIALRLTMRGTARQAGGSGSWAYPLGAVTVVEDGLCVRLEYFGDGDRDAMLARFGELSGPRAVLGDRPPERFFAEFIRRWDVGDLDALAELYADDWVVHDHRAVVNMEPFRGIAAAQAMFASIRALAIDIRFEVDEVLACDERVIVVRITWRGTAVDGGGEIEVPIGVVTVVRDGVWVSADVYEIDDRLAMIARYVELGGGLGPLGERPPERWWKRIAQAVATRDRVSMAELWEESYEFVDHRAIGWEDTVGPSAAVERWDGIWEGSSDVRLEVQEVLGCDERTIALRVDWRGSGEPDSGGGEFVVPVCVVAVIESDRALRWDQFEPEDDDAALARYAALSGRKSGLGTRPPERHLAEWIRRFGERDLEGALALYAEDWVLHERRSLATMEAVPRTEARALLGSFLSISPDIRLGVDEVLACDERVIAARVVWRGTARDGGGSLEVAVGLVEVIEDGLERSVDQFDSDDRPGMIARYVELGGGLGPLGERPPEQWIKRLADITATRDSELLPDLYAEDYKFTDHRHVSWEPTTTRREAAERVESTWTGTTDLHLEVEEVLACSERAIAVRVTWVGGVKADAGGGRFTYPLWLVVLLEGAAAKFYDQYEPEDRERALGRYAELSGHDGGEAESVVGIVDVVQNGLTVSRDQYDHNDADAMRARFAELTREADGPAEPTAIGHRDWLTRSDEWLAGEGGHNVAELIDPAAVVRDRRGFPSTDRSGVEAYHELVGPGTATALIHSQGDFVLGRRDDDPPLYLVGEIREGRLVEAIGLRDEERAREWLVALVSWRGFERAARAGDIEGLLAHQHPDGRIIDHRPLRFQDAGSREDLREIYVGLGRLLTRASASAEVLEVHPGATAVSLRWTGTDRESGGPVEWLTFHASRVRDGLYVETHTYADADSARAKLEELSPVAAGTRIAREYVEAINAEDFDALLALYTEDCVLVDHRPLVGWQDVDSSAGLVANYRSWKEKQLGEVTVRGEVLADAGGPFFRQVFSGVWQGGTWEIATDTINTLRDGRISRVETFDSSQVDGRRARAAELRGKRVGLALRPDQPPQRPPERYYDEWIRRWDARDLDGLVERYDEDWALREHRAINPTADYRGRTALRAQLDSILALSADARFEIDEILACDERVIAARITWRGTAADGGGEIELPIGFVTLIEHGREMSLDQFDVDDRQGMIARYAELGGGQGPLRDRPPERYLASWIQAHAARDMDRLAELTADPTVVDHRTLGWEQVLGEKHASSAVRSGWEVTTFFHLEVDEVLACDDDVIAARIAWRGSMLAGGGLFEIPSGLVVLVESGLAMSWDLYEPDDHEAMLGRFAELSGRRDPAGRAPERFHTEYVRRWATRDLDALLELYAEDWTMVDHRSLGMEPASGIEAARAVLASTLSMSPDLRFELDEVLASDDRVIATRVGYRGHASDGSGEAELLVGYVSRVIDERLVSTELYEPEDRQTMIARYAELGGGQGPLGDRPPERFWAEFCQRWAARDLERIVELYADDWVAIEHRKLGWQEMHGHEQAREHVRSVLAGVGDLRFEVEQVLGCSDRVIALIVTLRGTMGEHGGEWENRYGYVTDVRAGRLARLERYDHNDREAMLARFAELSSARPDTPERDAAAWLARHDELLERGNPDALATELLAPDVLVRDRRGFPTSDERGPQAYRSLVGPGAPSTLLDSEGELLLARRGEDPPLLLVGELRAGRLVEAIVLRDEVRARDWLTALRLARRYQAAGGDLDRIMAVHHPKSRMVDHRPMHLHQATDLAAIREFFQHSAALLERARASVEVLEVYPGAEVVAMTWRGIDRSTGGPVEWKTFQANRIRDGLAEEIHIYDDPEPAFAKAEGLSPTAPRIARLYIEAVRARDWEALAELYNDDCVFVEHRRAGREDFDGIAGLIAMFESTLELATGVTVRGEFLRDAGGDLYLRQILNGTREGGPWEVALDTISELRDGRFARIEQFDLDQAELLHARLAELRAARRRAARPDRQTRRPTTSPVRWPRTSP